MPHIPYTLPTTWERGHLRITPPRDRLANGSAAWLCNECGDRRAITTRLPADVVALTAEWHAHLCPPLPEGWLTAPAEMPCDHCRAHTRTRAPSGRPHHPACAPRPAPAAPGSERRTDRAAPRAPGRTPGTVRPARTAPPPAGRPTRTDRPARERVAPAPWTR